MSLVQPEPHPESRSGDEIAGTCFGFAVHSSLGLQFLRSGAGGEPLLVSAPSEPPEGDTGELVQQWRRTAEVPFETNLYRDGARFRLQMAGTSWFEIDTERPSVSVPEDSNTVRREERLWGIPAILCFLARGDLQLHAAAVEIDNGAVIIAAPQTHGKTTIAATFHNAGFRLLSEDVTCIRDLSAPHIVPGPAVLRVRLATAERIEILDAREVGVRDDRVHFAIAPERRGDCQPVPLRAILMLRESENGFRLERPAAVDAVRDIWPLSFNLPTAADRARCFAAITDLIGAVPVQNLYRPFRLEELPRAVSFVVDHV
jgi:hypothetical protein